MIFHDEGPRTVVFGEDVHEVLDFLKRPLKYNRDDPWSTKRAGDINIGNWSPEQGLWHARNGWSEGAAMIHDLLAGLPFENNATGLCNWRMDVAGELPDVARYASGEPAHMRNHARRQGNQKVLHLVINTARTGSSTSRQRVNYLVGICGLVDWLESNGQRCEIDRVGVVRDRHIRSFQGWKVKSASQQLDLSAAAYALIHDSAHQHLVWGMRERCRRVAWEPVPLRRDDLPYIGAENAFIINGVVNNARECDTIKGAVLLAAKRLNDFAEEELVDIEQLTAALADYVEPVR